MRDTGIERFLSDPMFGYRHDTFSSFPINDVMSDYRNICLISNKIESVSNPYDASRLAVSLTRHYRLSNFMKIVSPSSIKKDTITDNRFKYLENKIVLGVEKADGLELECCAPNCNNKAIKRSHSIQKKGVLETISNKENKVYQTKATAFSGANFMQEVGWNNASTFPGFCSDCERTLFSKAERRDAQLDKPNIEILIWRALCHTRFRRAQEVQLRGHIVSKPEAYDLSRELDDVLIVASSALLLKNRIHSFRLIDSWIASLEHNLGGGAARHLHLALRVPGLPFVGAGIIPIYYDFDRKRVQPADRFNVNTQSLAYTTCVMDGATHIVLCAKRGDSKTVRLLTNMTRMDRYLLSSFLPQIIMGGSDTVYFSIDYWDKQATELDKHIVRHAYLMNLPQMVFPFWGAMSQVCVDDVRIV